MASTITPRRELHTGPPIPMAREQAYPRARKQRLKIESGTLTPVRRIRTAHPLAEIRARLHASSVMVARNRRRTNTTLSAIGLKVPIPLVGLRVTSKIGRAHV